jgi:hypothetical protein
LVDLARRASKKMRRIFLCGDAKVRERSGNIKKDDRDILEKKRGATGITTAAPHIAGQWGRGE